MGARFVLFTACAVLAGCGYPGDILPPALNIPTSVRDLKAVQRGPDIVVTYTAPALSTEDLGIREFGTIDLRVGPPESSMDAWAQSATKVTTQPPEPGKPVTVKFTAAEWSGREVMVALRMSTRRS